MVLQLLSFRRMKTIMTIDLPELKEIYHSHLSSKQKLSEKENCRELVWDTLKTGKTETLGDGCASKIEEQKLQRIRDNSELAISNCYLENNPPHPLNYNLKSLVETFLKLYFFFLLQIKHYNVIVFPHFYCKGNFVKKNLPHGGIQVSYSSHISLNKRIYIIQDKECSVHSLGTCTFFLIHAHPPNCPDKRCPKATSSDSKVLADSSGLWDKLK